MGIISSSQTDSSSKVAAFLGITRELLIPADFLEGGGGVEEEGNAVKVMEGVASIALLPGGSISGHFIQLPNSICYGLHGF
ncbi:hypothetical protein OROHE_026488, partial [Orobanche hederae]